MAAHSADILVIGAAIAAASAAAHLAERARVVLREAEEQPGYHNTGRSAALFGETYGALPVRKALEYAMQIAPAANPPVFRIEDNPPPCAA